MDVALSRRHPDLEPVREVAERNQSVMTPLFCREQGGHGHVDRFRPAPVSAVGPALCKRSDGCGIRADRADAASGEAGRAAPNDGFARGAERHSLSAANRLSLRGLLAASLSGIGSMAVWPSIGGCCPRGSRRARRSTIISVASGPSLRCVGNDLEKRSDSSALWATWTRRVPTGFWAWLPSSDVEDRLGR